MSVRAAILENGVSNLLAKHTKLLGVNTKIVRMIIVFVINILLLLIFSHKNNKQNDKSCLTLKYLQSFEPLTEIILYGETRLSVVLGINKKKT